MLSTLRQVMRLEMTIAEWIGTAIIVNVPYLVIGVVWTATHTEHLDAGVGRLIQVIGSIACWPALVFSAVCQA